MEDVRRVQQNNQEALTMEKTLSSTEVRDSFGTVLDEVQFQGDKYIISRKGKPAVAIVPLDVYENWKGSRQKLFDLIRSFQESSGDNDPDEIMDRVLEAQQAIRKNVARGVKAQQ
jgi:prevent-host-death family protein